MVLQGVDWIQIQLLTEHGDSFCSVARTRVLMLVAYAFTTEPSYGP